jgi:ABC-type glycerol-3-phosphate transport system permease component
MPYSAAALISVIIFAFVHLWAENMSKLNLTFRSLFFSLGGESCSYLSSAQLSVKLLKKVPIIYLLFYSERQLIRLSY